MTNAEKVLKSHVLDDITYTRGQVLGAKAGLIIGLWGVFLTALIILFLCVKDVIPCYQGEW